MSRSLQATTLLDALDAGEPRTVAILTRTAAVVFVAGLTAAAAQVSVSIPLTEVPFTMQPMVVLLGGLVLGPRLGAAAQVLYVSAGIAGLPVFAVSPVLPSGAARLLGPTGGYLMSYPLAAWLTGWLGQQGLDRRYLTCVAAMAAGLAVIYACGVAWLGLLARPVSGGAPIGLGAAASAGLLPFLAADAIKLLAAGAVVPGLWWLAGHRR